MKRNALQRADGRRIKAFETTASPAHLICLVLLFAATIAISLLVPTARLAAQERILSYDSQIQIRADGGLDVTEQMSPDKYVEELLVDWREQVDP